MKRLGLGYDELYEVNPRLIYCSITGYGKEGPRAGVAAHDLNYVAEAGLLGLTTGADGAPAIDRKSTRLNSSHANISSAVFCLNKTSSRATWPRSPAASTPTAATRASP